MVNRAILLGHVGKDPETRTFSNGGRVANFSLATSEGWKDKTTGEWVDNTTWHNISVTNEHLVKLVEKAVHKGSKLYVEGKIETRSYEKEGETKYVTDIVLKPFNGVIVLLDKKEEEEKPTSPQEAVPTEDDLSDEIPF